MQNQTGFLPTHINNHLFVMLKIKMTRHWMMVKLEMTSGLFLEILFTVITWDPGSNFSCREKNRFLFHWNISTLPELPNTSLDVMLEKILTITGMLMEIVNCQIRGLASQNSPYRVKSHWMDFPGPERRLTRKQTTSRRQIVVRNAETCVWCIKT